MTQYDPSQCQRRIKGMAYTCRECSLKEDYPRLWCSYCIANTDYEKWEYENRGPHCTTCGTRHGNGPGECCGPG